MRKIRERNEFKRDFKRAVRGKYRDVLRPDGELQCVINMLKNDIRLPLSYRDHPLHNNLAGKRECHIRPDFLLIYYYEGDDWLVLDRLGSHSDLLGL